MVVTWPDDRLTVLGLPWWQETCPEFWRLPERLQATVPADVARLSQQPSGARLCFRTDARTLRMTWRFPATNRIWNMSDEGQRGIDLWVDGVYWRCFAPFGQEVATYTLWDGFPPDEHEVLLYLPVYAPAELVEFSADPDEATIEPCRPECRLEKPLVFYGTSITQGGCASRPSNTWPAVCARNLSCDFVNLSASGAARGEPEVAACIAAVDACCYVLDWGVNNATWQELAGRYGPFLDILREAHPETPIVCVSPIYSSTEAFSPDPRLRLMREHIGKLVADHWAGGDRNLYCLNGPDVLGPLHADGLADKTHVNDWGFRVMANNVGALVEAVAR